MSLFHSTVFFQQEDSSDLRSDDESQDTKTHHVLRRLKSGQYNNFFAGDVYRCPFCPTRRLRATDFNSLVKHAEDVRTCGESVNVHGFRAKHQALGLHLRNLQKVAIEEGRMPPIKPKAPKVKGLGSKKWRRRQREEADALLAEATRGH